MNAIFEEITNQEHKNVLVIFSILVGHTGFEENLGHLLNRQDLYGQEIKEQFDIFFNDSNY